MVLQELQQLAASSTAPAEATTSQQSNSSNPTSSNAHGQGQQQQGEVRLQVVSVGCGVDTRPWRLAFPPSVAWFDVDQQPVIDLKAKLLAEAGAEQQQQHETQQQQQQQKQFKFPLKCSTYTALASDATSSSWLNDLAAAGFSKTLPTVWVAEGLLYYLTPEQGAQLYADIAAAGKAGACVVLATHIPKCNLEANKTAPANHSLAGGGFVQLQRLF
jgi:O-methyltransferase involved in polyketide biosynthesis